MLKSLTILLVLSFVFHYCSTNSEPEIQNLAINEISISDKDSLSPGAGILIKFSNAIDLSSLGADSIYRQFDLYFSSPEGIESKTVNLEVYKIGASQVVQINGAPMTFYYDSRTWCIALIEETTIQMPEGTGDGFYLNLDENQQFTPELIPGNFSR
jgi:hypothetical protein